MTKPSEERDPAEIEPEVAQPQETEGEQPGACRPRAAAGDMGGFQPAMRGASPDPRAALSEALVAKLHAWAAEDRKRLEGKLVAIEAQLARIEELVAELTDSPAARAGTEIGDAVRQAVSALLADVGPIRAHLRATREAVAHFDALLAVLLNGATDHG
ncbi:MAG: hypothetical protein K8H90_07845 [Thermoanaerobaculia bacterium]|nr:hypothetical protein [Thermoanaerobaculia bacterium]